MSKRGFYRSWRRNLFIGFQACVTAIAVGILSQLFIMLVHGMDWLLPGKLSSIPEWLRMTISLGFFVFIMLPLFGYLFSQCYSLKSEPYPWEKKSRKPDTESEENNKS